jgi:hypothetical protein
MDSSAAAPSAGAKFIRMIVKNDSVKSDPHQIYGWRAFAMAGSACFGGMLFGFDIGTIGGVLELTEFQQYVGAPPCNYISSAIVKEG